MPRPLESCECCTTTREHPGYMLHCPSCIYCGARLIRRIQNLKRPADETKRRCAVVLTDWVAHGHDEALLRELAKESMALFPVPVPEPKPEKPKKRGT